MEPGAAWLFNFWRVFFTSLMVRGEVRDKLSSLVNIGDISLRIIDWASKSKLKFFLEEKTHFQQDT